MSMLSAEELEKLSSAESLFPRLRPAPGGASVSTTLVPSLICVALISFALHVSGQELPDGKGKEIVLANCNGCHTFYSRVGAGYTAKGWDTVMRMMANHGITVPADQVPTLMDYLTKNFPETGKPVGVVIAGPAKVSIKEWQVPTPGSRPHDPLATQRETALSGTPARWPMCLVGSIRRRANSRNIR